MKSRNQRGLLSGRTVLIVISLLSLFASQSAVFSKEKTVQADLEKSKGDTKRSKFDDFVRRTDPAMEKWRDDHYGQFVTWGLFSLLGGEYKGRQSKYAAEWIGSGISRNEYRKLLPKFNPTNYNPKAWARLFKRNGAKSVLITAKFHDGFCLWDSAFTDFDVASTPYKKDMLREFIDAMRSEGLEIVIYYSIIDWDNLDYRYRIKDEDDKKAFRRYMEYMKNQLRELLTNFGDIQTLWFDGRWDPSYKLNPAYGQEIERFCRSIDPDIIINDRVRAYDSVADFDAAFERRLPPRGINHPVDWGCVMTQTRMTTWGWSKAAPEKGWRSAKEMIEMIAKCAANNGNFLLNVAPTADGSLQDIEKERLEEIGDWMRVNGEAINGCRGIKSDIEAAGAYISAKGNKVYVMVFDKPESGRIEIGPIKAAPARVTLLKDLACDVSYRFKDERLTIEYPENISASDGIVFRLEFSVSPEKDPAEYIRNELFEPLSEPINLGKAAKASSVYKELEKYDAAKAVDKSGATRWSAGNNEKSGWLEVDLGDAQVVSAVRLNEAGIKRISSFSIEYKDAGQWKTAYTGNRIDDGKKIVIKSPFKARYVRILIKDSTANAPTLSEFYLYR